MKLNYVLGMIAALTIAATVGSAEGIIPQPLKMVKQNGAFEITDKTKILVSADLAKTGQQLVTMLEGATGYKRLPILKQATDTTGVIELKLDSSLQSMGEESYTLEVTPNRTLIKTPTATGVFYGIQSLRQLLPVEIASPTPRNATSPLSRRSECLATPAPPLPPTRSSALTRSRLM